MPQGGKLTLAADMEIASAALPHPAGLQPGRYIRIEVSDTGSGMDQTVLARVTEPFFTTKEPGKGTGLGLAMAKGFVEQSGGSLSIDSVVGQGTRIIMWLPIMPGVDAPHEARSRRTKSAATGQRCFWSMTTRSSATFCACRWRMVAMPCWRLDPAVALSLLDAGEAVDIIVSDLTMPGMDGLELIRGAQARRMNLPAVLLTGYAGDGAALAVGGAISGAFSLLRKPVSGAQLVEHQRTARSPEAGKPGLIARRTEVESAAGPLPRAGQPRTPPRPATRPDRRTVGRRSASPTGNPSAVNPHGTLAAGFHDMLNG